MANKFLVLCLCFNTLYVSSLVPRLKDDYKPPTDYRPSKWISNSALDVWFGNKSMVDILAREFNQIVERIAVRPVRSINVTLEGQNNTVLFKGNTTRALKLITLANNTVIASRK